MDLKRRLHFRFHPDGARAVRATGPRALGAHPARRLGRLTSRALLVVWLPLLLLAGCGEPEIDTVYGSRSGTAARSVNGTSVLGGMFEEAGHRVSSWPKLSPSLRERAEVIVWFPSDFNPPSVEAQEWLEAWLDEQSGRTLIYVGRDFDAAPLYWRKVRPLAPPEQQPVIAQRAQRAEAAFLRQREALPANDDWHWFRVQGQRDYRQVRSLSGDAQWLAGIDPAGLEVELHGRIHPLSTAPGDLTPEARDLVERFDLPDLPWDSPDEEEADEEVLLASEGDVLVLRRAYTYYYGASETPSQLIVVANGSFLLNVPLVNPEHRKLAASLIRQVGPAPQHVVFLEADSHPAVSEEEEAFSLPTGMELLGVAPFNHILLHLALLGLVFCFARLPIFGRPRELPSTAPADFGQHVAALGDLLARTGDRAYALTRLEHYQQLARDGSPSLRRPAPPPRQKHPR